jgi:putative CocE/NonD family hydrolase
VRRAAIAAATAAATALVALPAGLSPTSASAAPPATAAAGAGWQERPAQYGVHVTEDVPVTMSDGTRLRVNVYRPADADGSPAPGRFPVVVTQTPYNKSGPGLGFRNDYLVERGYVQVVADVRGTGSSEGRWASFDEREQRDGAELVAWAHSRKRAWSNGRIGLWGISYGAINQLLTAAQRPPGLRATFPIVPAGDVYRDVVASGGQIDSGFMPFWLGLVTATGLVPPAVNRVEPDAALLTLLEHIQGALDFQVPTITDALAGGDMAYDGPFYRLRSPLEVVDRIDVPTFLVGGEYDLFQRGTPMLYDALRRRGVPSRLLIGPWTHVEAAQAPDLPASVAPSLDALAVRWFDRYVRGEQDPALDEDVRPVTYHEIGSGRWRTAPRWMPRSVRASTYQLDGTAAPGSPGVLRAGEPRAEGGGDVYPVPVAGLCTRSASQWTAGLAAIPGCETDNRLNDQLGTAWETAPLEKPVHLMGPVNARLFVSTTARDGMLSVAVEDVAPDGTVDRLTGGWQVLSHRKLVAKRSLRRDGEVLQPWHPFTRKAQLAVEPGEVVRVDVEVFPTGAKLRKGHRLRVTVQAFDTPHLTPTAPQVVDSAGGVITVHSGPEHPSRLVLPVRG